MKEKIEKEDLNTMLNILHKYDTVTVLATVGVITGMIINSEEDPLTRRALMLGHIKGLLA